MKQCPVCKEMSFDDAETCFGCLHRFSDEEGTLAAQGRKGVGPAGSPNEACIPRDEVPHVVVRIDFPGFSNGAAGLVSVQRAGDAVGA